ncbi:Antitoxin [Candidatus Desulfarcum epimagneticum]|uniref:Antitoxin n=1 Tax=uncultured Desulfobacteraceae bacterium TaxID=218296 RepID=A0A484HI45_9BACT|nr:Antitoxin [uncultured Desulfobacteraceae bacterium]
MGYMYDRALVTEILSQILRAADTILYRFSQVKTIHDLTDSPAGMEKLDSICMQLIAIGEGLKNIDKTTDHTLLAEFPEINWEGAKTMRDIMAHHYFRIDAEIVFEVCENKITPLRDAIEKMIQKIK